MDEWMLNDLLECSVCLERLDTSSKVLPCQHTFCKKCLEEIVTTHKELRCPECRVLVDIKIGDLPPNVLLMRILEGMRNAAPKKRNSGGTPGSAVAPLSGNRSANPSHHHHMSPPHQLYQQLYHPPSVPPQQPPPSLQLQQQHHLHQLATSVSSHGSGSTQSNNFSSTNPIQSHLTQIPRFCYTPNQHILSPQLGKSDCNPNFPTALATGHAVPATITLNPCVTTKNNLKPVSPAMGAGPISLMNHSTSNNNQNQLFYSFPQARLISSAGGITSAQIVQHCQINTLSPMSAGVTPKHDSSVVSTHTSNGLSNGTPLSPTQTCPHSYPGFGSISSVGLVPRSQHNASQIHPPNSSTTAFNPDQQWSTQPASTCDTSSLTTGPLLGQQRLSQNSKMLLPQFTTKQNCVTVSDTSTSNPNTSQNYLFLSNSRSSPSQGSIDPNPEASGSSTNQSTSAGNVGSSKITPVFSLTNNRPQINHSQASDVALLTSTSQSNIAGNVATSNLQNLAHANMAPLISPLPGSQHQCKHGSQTGSTVVSTSLFSNLSTSQVSTGPNQSTAVVQSTVPKDRRTETKDLPRSRPNSVYQYSQLADCLSLSSSSVLPSKPDCTNDAISEDNIAPPPPVRSESITQTDTDTNAQQSSVGNTAVIGAKSIGNTDSSVTAQPSTAANQSVPFIKGINQPCARAVYDYLSKMPGDLSFKEGDLIILRRKIDNNWYHGECRGQSGVFPLSYVQILTPLPNHIPQCKALFDFRMNNDDEEGCLTFNKGDVVTVIRRVDENWAEGRLGERIGIFPLAFVELNNVARALMKLSINSQPGPSRLAPPTPTVDDSTPLIPTDHSPTVSTTASLHTTTGTTSVTTGGGSNTTTITTSSHATMASDGSTSTTLTSPSSSSTSSTSSSSSSTTPPTSSSASSPSSPGSHPPPPPSHPHPVQSVKRHSFTLLQQQQQQQQQDKQQQQQQHTLQPPDQQHLHQHNNRHSAEILTTSEHSSSVSHGPHSLAVMTSSSNSSANTPVHSVSAADSSALMRSGSQRRHHQRSASADAHHAGTPLPATLLPPQHASLQLPATYVALYPYKPQKSDELELKRGNVYTVTERCQDGWFKGTNKHQKCGVFPGNYVAPSKSLPAVQAQLRGIGRIAIVGTTARNGSATPAAPSPEPRTYFRFSGGQNAHNARLLAAPGFGNVVGGGSSNPPELPPRSVSPGTISSSWHSGDGSTPTRAHNMSASVGSSHHDNSNSVGRNSPITVTSSPPNVTVSSSKSSEKVKEKKERTSGGGIMRIFSMKKSPPPPTTYSMDNPVFEDGTTSTAATTSATTTTTTTIAQPLSPPHQPTQLTPVHVRSGSCPSQLLQVTPSGGDHARSSPSHHHHHHQHQHHHHRLFSPSSSQRLKNKERPTVNIAHFSPRPGDSSLPAPPQHHRKSNSLDASATLGGSGSGSSSAAADTRKQSSKQLVPVVRERFRCIVPYPPNSEYELELQVGDLIYVHRKREDGWYKGTQQRTGKTGLFPASFVESF